MNGRRRGGTYGHSKIITFKRLPQNNENHYHLPPKLMIDGNRPTTGMIARAIVIKTTDKEARQEKEHRRRLLHNAINL